VSPPQSGVPAPDPADERRAERSDALYGLLPLVVNCEMLDLIRACKDRRLLPEDGTATTAT